MRRPSSRTAGWAAGLAAVAGVAAAVAVVAGCATLNVVGRLSATRTGDLRAGPGPRAEYRAAQRAACGAGGLTGAGALALDRRPYLQQVTDRSAMVLWTQVRGVATTVQVTTPGGELVATVAAEVDASAPLARVEQRVASLAGLSPATMYCYRIDGPQGPLVLPTGFRTAPPPGADVRVELVAFGDMGWRTLDQAAVRQQLIGVPMDLVVLTGDIAYSRGTLRQFEENFFAVYDQIMAHVPFFPVAGNHDYKTADGEVFRQVFALFDSGSEAGRERWYAFDWGPIRFIGLDTEVSEPAQVAWLERELEANRRPWVIVFLHRPPVSAGYHGSDEEVRRAFSPLFKRFGVPLVLAGHEHDYQRSVPIDGVTYVVTGGGGRGTRRVGRAPFTAFSEAVAHFVHITVEGDTLTLRAIDATGATFDTAVIQRVERAAQ